MRELPEHVNCGGASLGIEECNPSCIMAGGPFGLDIADLGITACMKACRSSAAHARAEWLCQ